MKTVLVLGGTGHLGRVLIKLLLDRNYFIVALVRDPTKINFKHEYLNILHGNVFDQNDLSKALSGVEIVVSTLGHGFRTRFPIQEKTITNLFPIMEKNKVKRFITVTGAGLKVMGDPHSFIADISEKIFYIVDPYRMSDAKKQQLLLEKSTLDWTVVRTPIHNNSDQGDVSHIGLTQPPPWKTISRISVSKFIIECIEKNLFIKKAPIIY